MIHRMYINVKVQRIEYCALIDTGCYINFITHPIYEISNLVAKTGLDIHEQETTYIKGVSQFWIQIGPYEFKANNFYLNSKLKCDFILGQQFLFQAFESFGFNNKGFFFETKCKNVFMIPFTQRKLQTNLKLLQSEQTLAKPGEVDENKLEISKNLTLLLESIYEENPRAFSQRYNYKVKIELDEKKMEKRNFLPVYEKPRKYSKYDLEDFPSIMEKLLKNQLIRKSTSPWNCPGFLVRKYSEIKRGEPRLVIDYKPLNQVVKGNTYPLPRKEVLFDKIKDKKIFSKFDCKSGFFQIELEEFCKEYTAFSVPNGHYEWNVLPMGLKTSPALFQERMDKIFNDYRDFILVYIDDILVFSETAQEHRKHLFIFASLAYENGLVISKKKVEIGKSRIEYLGLIIENGRVQLQENIIKTILSFPDKLKDKKHLQSFLGHLNYAINFIPWCSLIREKLQSKLRGNKTFEWSEEDTQSLKSIKKFIKENVKPLELPTDEDDLYIQTDASDLHWGAVLRRQQDDIIVLYASGTFKGSEVNYDINEKETLAVKKAIEKFEYWIINKRFYVETDNSQVIAFIKNKIPDTLANRRRARWSAFFSAYDFEIRKIKSHQNCFADFLSRYGSEFQGRNP